MNIFIIAAIALRTTCKTEPSMSFAVRTERAEFEGAPTATRTSEDLFTTHLFPLPIPLSSPSLYYPRK